jgi:pimeloyl-ACP methyl ester carboxylesterase
MSYLEGYRYLRSLDETIKVRGTIPVLFAVGGTPMNPTGTPCAAEVYTVHISPIGLAGTLWIPAGATALVVFAHGSGSSRLSPRNMAVAEGLNEQGIATLLFDLLTLEEEVNRANVFNIRLLAERVIDAVNWTGREPLTRNLRLGLFGASTGAAAALVAAARLGDQVRAIVSRGVLTLPAIFSTRFAHRHF